MEKAGLRRKGSYKNLSRRRSRRKPACEIGKEELSQEKESSSHHESSCPSERSQVEKGPSNGQLLGGPADPSGCPSSTTLSRGNSSARPTTSEKLQSMPVTSRPKRLRGATTSSQQNNRIAFTDRKTRSASSSFVDNTIVIKSEIPSQSSGSFIAEVSPINNACFDGIDTETKNFSTSSERKGYVGNKVGLDNEKCATEVDQCEEGILSGTVKPEVPSETNFAIAAKATTSSGSSDWNSSTVTSTNPTNDLSHIKNDICEAEKAVIEPRSDVRQCAGEVKSNSFKSDVVESCRKRSKVNDQKLTLAPMLLMNNLPYMGELTFDTRPRRGRKPKKADICHLISKNYGIHFPNSYTNVPNTGTPITTTTASYPPTKIRTKVNPTVKVKSSKRHSSKSGAFSTCPPASWTISPPDLLPISVSGQNRILGLSNTSLYPSTKTSASLSKSNPSASKVSSNACIKSIKQKNQPNMLSGKGTGQDEPLNLCVRDASSQEVKSQSQSTLSAFDASYAGIMNLKLPLTSPNSLFSDFHLNQVGSRMSHTSEGARGLDESIRKSRSIPGGSGNNNAKGSSSDKTISDLNLVNNLNLQLSLANNFQGNGPILSKSRGKMSHALRFVPPLTTDTPGFNKTVQHKKGRKRRSPTLNPDDSNQMDIKAPLLAPSSSSNIFLNSSSVHPSSSAVSNVESHAGGCLFGQSDSGMNSGGAQVSICKFKFTGGAKPSLQEKKMLSVDSGGNFRFYTDKCGTSSMKSLKGCNSGINQGSTTPFHNSLDNYGEQDCQYAFSSLPKSAKSMSVCMPVRPSSLQTTYSSSPVATASSSRLIEPQKSPPLLSVSPASMELRNLHLDTNSHSGSGSVPVPSAFPCEDGYSSSQSDNSNSGTGPPSESACGSNLSTATASLYQNEGRRNKLARFKRKRRTRKSLMREKLEKTFKEKGFLIQTQQLESAEGATYCKFRQLRKFTRYLFRSWKDYLPDNVRDINAPGANKGEGSSINLATSSAGGHPEGGESGSGMEMELDLTTTNSQDPNGLREDSDEEDNEEDCEGMDPGRVPVILPVKNLSRNNSHNDTNPNDSEVSNDDVDVENIDGTSDNSSLQYNANINIKQEDNDDSNADKPD